MYKFIGTIDQLQELGFTKDENAIYPRKMKRDNIKIGISEPCINMWDLKDKNNSMIFTKLIEGTGVRSFYTYDVEEDIRDIIDSGLVKEIK